MKNTTLSYRRTVLLALAGVALLTPSIHAQTNVTPQLDDLILGFYSTAPGQSSDLEVDLGDMSNFYNATGVVPLPALAVQDLVNTFGANWYTSTNLFWGAVSTTGRATGTADGHAPVGTLWASAPVGQTAFNRGSVFAQKAASPNIEGMIDSSGASDGTLYGATSTTNSDYAAVIEASLEDSWTSEDLKNTGQSFGYFTPTVDNSVSNIALVGQAMSDLYELQPTTNQDVPATLLGELILTQNGLTFHVAGVSPPVASFTASPLNGPAPLQVNFTNTSSGSPTSWSWTFGDGIGTSAAQDPTYTYDSPGTYTVTQIVANASGSSTNTGSITVTGANSVAPPVASFTNNPAGGPSPLTVDFFDTSSHSPTSWSWTFGDGIGTSAAQDPTYTYDNPGTYTVTQIVANASGSSTNTGSITVTSTNSAAPPVASFTNNPAGGAAPLTVDFYDTSANSPTSWSWTFGDGIGTSAVQDPTYTYDNPGTYTVTQIVANANGSSTNTGSITVTSTNAAAPVAGFTASPLSGPAPLQVTFTNSSSGSFTSSSWTFGDGGTSSAPDPSHIYGTAGVYSVTLTVQGPGGSNVLDLPNFITVTNFVVIPTSVSIILPATGMEYPPGGSPTIVALARSNLAITNIEFFGDGTDLGGTTSNPGTNVWWAPANGQHLIVCRATDSSGNVATSAAVAVTCGVKNSPLGDWELTITGPDQGIGFLTFAEDFTATGYGIRLHKFGLDDISGTWGFNSKGQVTGPFIEQLDSTTDWTGTLTATAKSLKTLSGTVPTAHAGVFHWSAIPATTIPDLSGIWTGTLEPSQTSLTYLISSNANDSAVFDVAEDAYPNPVIGQLIATSKNKVDLYLTNNGTLIICSGSVNAQSGLMTLRGTDAAGVHITISLKNPVVAAPNPD